MANKHLFASTSGPRLPVADATNEAGGPAYALTAEQGLAQFAATGCLNGTFYASDVEQLASVLELARACAPEFVARTALFAREQGAMKDMPALLCAVLAVRDGALLDRVFDRVIDSARMLRNFVQMVRSGVTGRKSLGTLPRRLVRRWLAARTESELFRASAGNDPSLADVIKMVHPKPATPARDHLYRYLIGRPAALEQLPEEVQQLERLKVGQAPLADVPPPDVPFLFLTGLPLSAGQWRAIALRASWTATRMNLNTFLRHGVFADGEAAAAIATRLADPELIRQARVFPYQIMTTLLNLTADVPACLRTALEAALETAAANVPALPGRVVVALDVSSSMHSPVTGERKGATTRVRCVDVAALFAAAIRRQSPTVRVIPFHDRVCPVDLDPKASVMATARKLATSRTGGTNCSAVLAHLNAERAGAEMVIYLSDNQSWVDAAAHPQATGMMVEWREFRRSNPTAKLVCIDLQPYRTVQAPVADAVVHVGGFSDQVFEVLRAVAEGQGSADLWVDRIREVAL
jgi:60 kDa SS-A/Ro ribonucleoprotein